ncbi:MAG: aminotransferase class I/II-fold pyridoxal phosphate-dependent enzyme [Bacillota bacterium]|jgi:cystathionine beta-lyase family protein involved in aluminum resistance
MKIIIDIERASVLATQAMEMYRPIIEKAEEKNFTRVLEAFRQAKISSYHFQASSGYGYNDDGRDKLEELYAMIFGTEAALVRQQIVSGTHAIFLALSGNLLPGDELLTLGLPYDTLQKALGLKSCGPCTLKEQGVLLRSLDIDFNDPDPQMIADALLPQTKILSIQRSRGYAWRNTLSVEQIAAIAQAVKAKKPDTIVFVDNCYGEMVEDSEPSHHGIDLMAGSLIKNLGAGLAPGGGYVVGKADLIDRAACRLIVPGAGREMGPSITNNRLYYQSLFLAPQIVKEAVLGAVYSSSFFSQLGFEVSPTPQEMRHDIIQAIKIGNPEKLIAYCQGIQRYSPIDSFAVPEPWPMPGYEHDVIMAAGAFVQGCTIELSADAPIREPYILYLQGGLTHHHLKYALLRTVQDMQQEGLL